MVASALLPLGLLAGVAALVYSQKQPPRSTCAILTPQERSLVDNTLMTSDRELLVAAAGRGQNQPGAVHDINTFATVIEARGCADDARRLRMKAASVARHPPVASPLTIPQLPPPPGSVVGSPPPPVVPMEPMGAGVPWPGAPTTAWPAGGAAASAAPATPAIPMQTTTRCWIRPEPRAPMDPAEQERFGFTCPAKFPLTLLAFGPPSLPPGWAHVELQHPDHGPVQGYVEIANLAGLTAAQPSAAAKAAPASPATPPAGTVVKTPNGAIIKTADGKTVMMPTMASALAGMSAFQGRKRKRPQKKASS